MPITDRCSPSRVSRTAAICAALLLALCVVVRVEALKVHLFSNTEIDPSYGTPLAFGSCTSYAFASGFGQPGCEAPLQLVTVLAQDAAAQPSNFSLFTGDMIRQAIPPTSSVRETLLPSSLALMMWKNPTLPDALPTLTVALGANDIPHFNITDTSNSDLQAAASVLRMRQLLTESEVATFSKCGFYARNVSNTVRLVVLNTVLYSNQLTPAVAESVEDPCEQLAFLKGELETAKTSAMKVMIMGNIPPTVNVTEVVLRGEFNDEASDMLWIPRFQHAYVSLVSAYAGTVALQLYGHTYRFSVVADPSVGAPLVTLPSVTPLMGNTPSYTIAQLSDANATVEGLKQRRMASSNSLLEEVDVSAALGLDGLWGNCSLMQAALREVRSSDRLWRAYLDVAAGGADLTASCSGSWCRRVTGCGMSTVSYPEWKSCVENK